MSYDLTGTVKLVQDAQTFGSGFTKRELVVTVDGKFPQDICIEFMQDKVSLLDSVSEGQDVTVSFDVRGREYNGKYFNNLVGWKLVADGDAKPKDEPADTPDVAEDPDDDIPF